MRRFAFAFIAIVVGGNTLAASDQCGCGPFDVYDRLIPAAVTDSDKGGSDEVIVIRFVPGDSTRTREYRTKIVASADGKIVATRVTPMTMSLLQQVRAAEDRRPEASCDEWLSDVRLQTLRFDNQQVLRRLLRKFDEVYVPARLNSAIYLDAPRYEIEVWEKMNETHYVLYEARDMRGRRLVEWAKQVSAALASARGISVATETPRPCESLKQ